MPQVMRMRMRIRMRKRMRVRIRMRKRTKFVFERVGTLVEASIDFSTGVPGVSEG